MIVYGGHNGASDFADGAMYDPIGDTWTALTSTGAPTARGYLNGLFDGVNLLAWGGYSTIGAAFLDTGAMVNISSNSNWNALSPSNAPTPRASHSNVWTGSNMIVFGGTGTAGAYFGDGGIFNPGANTWGPVGTDQVPTSRADHVSVWTGSKMLVWGGWDGTTYLGNGAVYDP
jgi:N-acetylneuraminic acid mutarotase